MTTLYIVATPLGNLTDISLRAIEVLKEVDFIAAEDTRHSASLLQHYGIPTATFSLHDHNEREKTQSILDKLQQGQSVALISDAGTPLISDPGYFLVKEARKAGFQIIPIPGACAAIAALSASGLPTDRFVFEGFPPSKEKARIDFLTRLKNEDRTIIFYEAPHRILDLLKSMQSVFGDARQCVLARELTKRFETIHSANLADMTAWVEKDANQQRGEIVVVVQGAEKQDLDIPHEKILSVLVEHLPLKQAAEIAAEMTGERKNELYQMGGARMADLTT